MQKTTLMLKKKNEGNTEKKELMNIKLFDNLFMAIILFLQYI